MAVGPAVDESLLLLPSCCGECAQGRSSSACLGAAVNAHRKGEADAVSGNDHCSARSCDEKPLGFSAGVTSRASR